MTSPAARKFPLVAAVEALHAEGYVVLGPENAEETAVLLGGIAHGEEIADAAERASDVLAAFPKDFARSGPFFGGGVLGPPIGPQQPTEDETEFGNRKVCECDAHPVPHVHKVNP